MEVTSSIRIAADFASGKITRIDLGGTGRPVVGKLRPYDGFGEKVLWNFALVNVQPDLPRPKGPDVPDEVIDDGKANLEKLKAWRQRWLKTDEGRAWQAAEDAWNKRLLAAPYITATVDRDGSFRIDDMPAGDYLLRVRFHPHQPGYLSGHRFSVPPIKGGQTSQPLDLGVLTLQEKASVRSGEPMPPARSSTGQKK